MKIKSFASSSHGNLYSVESNGSRILLECGLPAKKLHYALDYKVTEYDACLISHSHKDHCCGADFINKLNIPIYATKETLEVIGFDGFDVYAIEFRRIGDFVVKAFRTEHDCFGSCGFYIKSISSGEKMIFATDTFYLRQRFPALDYIMVECNYSDALLEKDTNCEYASRLKKSHMSLDYLKRWLRLQDVSRLKKVYLLHLSDGHSDEKQFKKEIEEMLFCEVEVCQK